MASADKYLNFEVSEDDLLPIYIDEGSSLAWQNSNKLLQFAKQSQANIYCQNLKLGKHQWSLPTTQELQTLQLYSNIAFGQGKMYLTMDRPVWDNTLINAYDSKAGKAFSIKQESQKLFVRCVSRLED